MNVRYHTIAPPPQLAEVVRFFWVLEMDGLQGTPYVYRSMADGCAELVFHYRGAFSELANEQLLKPVAATLHAQTAIHRRFQTQEDFGIFGAYLFPYALPRLFGISASALTNEMPDLPTLLGNAGMDLVEQMMAATDEPMRLRILANFLLQCLQRGKATNPTAQNAIQMMVLNQGQLSVAALSHRLGLSTRQIERQFQEYAGFSPKTYARILRFQSSLQAYGMRDKSLTNIALDCGYYDQAHFIHDFQQFSGYVPGEYFKGNPEGAEYRQA